MLIVAAPQRRGCRRARRQQQETIMRNFETVAFGAAALVAQALVVATIFVA
jgi:hypothetical protein